MTCIFRQYARDWFLGSYEIGGSVDNAALVFMVRRRIVEDTRKYICFMRVEAISLKCHNDFVSDVIDSFIPQNGLCLFSADMKSEFTAFAESPDFISH